MSKINRRDFIQYSSFAGGGVLLPQLWQRETTGNSPVKFSNEEGDFRQYHYPRYNLNTIGFTKANSWLMLIKRGDDLLFKTIDHDVISEKWMPHWANDLFRIRFWEGDRQVPFEFETSPWSLKIRAGRGELITTFMDDETLLFETNDLHFSFDAQQSVAWEFDLEEKKTLLLAQAKRVVEVRSEENRLENRRKNKASDLMSYQLENAGAPARFAMRVSKFDHPWREPLPVMAKTINKQQRLIQNWMDRMPAVPTELEATARTAWYYLWHAQHDPVGLFKHRVIFSSKNTWLTRIWAWDNCFHGLAVASADLELAWDQMFIFFDHQEPSGVLPEPMSYIQLKSGFVKPPVYGWTILKLIETAGPEACKPYVERAYPHVEKLTEWWLNYRDFNGNGLASYLHGNDSGWDNATAFDQGTPLESPDLAAHLIMQMESLAVMADMLGRRAEAERWRKRSEEHLDLMATHLTENDLFIARKMDGTKVSSQTLLYYIPMLLGKRLPESIRNEMIKNLQDGSKYLTDYGLATEAIDSPEHKEDGYWRGPIWAPSTYLIFDGLLHAGEKELARTIAKRYCLMCKKDPGMWENYDAVTGKGRQGPAVTWTSAVFILLADWLRKNS